MIDTAKLGSGFGTDSRGHSVVVCRGSILADWERAIAMVVSPVETNMLNNVGFSSQKTSGRVRSVEIAEGSRGDRNLFGAAGCTDLFHW